MREGMSEDAAAIEAIRQGDTERYGELVERYQRAVYAIAWSRLGDADLSEEAVQETFVQGFRYLGGLRKPERFPAWIGRIARRMASAIGRRRRRELAQRERWQVEELASPLAREGSDERVSETLGQALAALPDAHRESLVLFYLEGKSVREAAVLLGIREGAFKVRLHRARGKLREAMEVRLERSLRELAPRVGLRKRILAVLPAFPLGWEVKAGALGALYAVVVPVLATVPGIAFTWYLSSREAASFRDQGGIHYRRHKRLFVGASVCSVLMSVAFFLVLSKWGPRVLYGLIGVFILLVSVRAGQVLWTRRSWRVLAILLSLCGVAAATVAFAFLGASPVWYHLATLAMFVTILFTQKGGIPRLDASLFLRAAHGGLGVVPAGEKATLAFGREEISRFAQFLRERALAVAQKVSDTEHGPECAIYSMPLTARAELLAFLLPAPFPEKSTITVHSDGTCTAQVSASDLRELRALDDSGQLNVRELERHVSDVVRAALSRFLAGDTAAAEALVRAQPDEAIFKQSPQRRTMLRVACILGIVLFFLMLLFDLLGLPYGA